MNTVSSCVLADIVLNVLPSISVLTDHSIRVSVILISWSRVWSQFWTEPDNNLKPQTGSLRCWLMSGIVGVILLIWWTQAEIIQHSCVVIKKNIHLNKCN